jgi:hypothetical protein
MANLVFIALGNAVFVIWLYDINQRNANFSKYLVFIFRCILHVSTLLGSSSGRQLYVLYGMFYIQLSVHTDAPHTFNTAYATVSPRMNVISFTVFLI